MSEGQQERTYDLVDGEWTDIGMTAYGVAKAMPNAASEDKATKIIVQADGNVHADGVAVVQYS